MRKAPLSVWRVAVLWQDAVLDVVTVKKRRARIPLRTGEILSARVVGDHIVVEASFGAFKAQDGELVALPAGHALLVHEDVPAPAMPGLEALDSTLFHAAMIGAAVQAVFVSALVLTPTPVLDPDSGAGWTGELRRIVVAPGGTASRLGAPSLRAIGRAADEAEKRVAEKSAGVPLPTRASSSRVSSEQALREIREALHLGDGGTELKDALGELARSVASAPQLGAGVGGLTPLDPPAPGVGNGLIGPGQSQLSELLRERIHARALAPEKHPLPERKPIGPVTLVDVPRGEVALDPAVELDPLVRDEIGRAVKRRHNAIRYCYESWGLAADADRSGKLTLELTLLPNGRITDARAITDDRGLQTVGECVARMAGEWYLGDGLVDAPTRLAFPFVLKPRTEARGEASFDSP